MARRRSSIGRGVFSFSKALLASAKKTGPDETQNLQRLHQPWQARAFSFYNRMGECWNPAQFTARALSKARLYAAVPDPEREGEYKELTSGWAFDLVREWQEIPEPYGRLRALIGEGRLTQSRPPRPRDADESTPVAPPVWEFLSPTELMLQDEGRKVKRIDGADSIYYDNISRVDGAGDPEPGEMRMWRFWRPHPENSGMADSAFRGVLDLYDQLYWLTLSERADLRNRAVNQGILLVPEEIDFEEDDEEAEQQAGEDTDKDPFQRKLNAMLSIALEDPGSAAAASPGVVRGPGDELHPDRFRHIRFHDPSSSLYMSDRERSLIQRIALGLDMPVEEASLTGLGSLNHWSAWKVEDAKFQHVQPEGEALAMDLTEIVLRPIGRASGHADAETVIVLVDWAQLVSDPDKGKTAIELRKIGAIGDPATREANDFDESAAMTPEERLEFLAIAMRDPTLIGGEANTTDPAQNEEPPADETPVDPGAEPDPQANTELFHRVVAAAAMESRTAIGKWVLSKRRSCPACFAEIESASPVRPEDVIPRLGPERLAAVGENVASLSARMRDRFYSTAKSMGYAIQEEQAAPAEMWFARNMFSEVPDYAELIQVIG